MKKTKILLGVFIILQLMFAINIKEVVVLQDDMTKRAQRIVDRYLGENMAVVDVKIELKKDSVTKFSFDDLKNVSGKADGDTEKGVLPGYSIFLAAGSGNGNGADGVTSRKTREVMQVDAIDSVYVSLVLEESLSEEKSVEASRLIAGVLKLDLKRDKIETMKINMMNGYEHGGRTLAERLSSAVKSDRLISLYIKLILFSVMAMLFMLIAYLLISSIMKKDKTRKEETVINQNVKTNKEDGVAIDDGEDQLELAPVVAKQIVRDQKLTETGQKKLFSFINEDNLHKLAFLVKEEDMDKKIAIFNFISPQLAAKLLAMFSREEQKELILNIRKELLLSPEDIVYFEQEIMTKIDFLAGGTNFTLNMFEFLAADESEEILEAVGEANQEFADIITNSLFVYEDIQYLDKRYLGYVVKEVGAREFSYTLMGTSEEFKLKIYSNLSEGVVEMIKQSLSLIKNQPKSKVQEIKHKIVTILKRMNKEGLIASKGELTQVA